MLANPWRKGILVEIARCQGQHRTNCVHLLGNQFVPIEGKEETDGEKGDSLVAVVKRMILSQSETVRSREHKNVGIAFVGKSVARTIKGGVQESFVPYTGKAAIFCKRSRMEVQNRAPVNPARLVHLARARKVSLYSPMNSKPSFTCASTSGS